MKRLALVLLALSTGGAAAPVEITVSEAANPVMCEINNQPVKCAYLYALFQKIRDEQRNLERWI